MADLTLSFVCPHCGNRIQVPVKFAGRKGHCAKCKALVQIPAVAAVRGGQPAEAEASRAPVPAASTPVHACPPVAAEILPAVT
ncbi:MAG: hypothetical protein NTV86_22180, partial [Planctomycetota bacterium]|nr:hypothetical protein [Planctomycetota bacterium]